METRPAEIKDLFQNFYSVPDFQREFVWTAGKHVDQLLTDLLQAFQDSSPEEYFLGCLVLLRTGWHALPRRWGSSA